MRMTKKGQFHNSLYLGNVEERVNVLRNAGMPLLASVVASTHGLKAMADEIATANLDLPAPPQVADPALLVPPVPTMQAFDSNWPLLTVAKVLFPYFFPFLYSRDGKKLSSKQANLTNSQQNLP